MSKGHLWCDFIVITKEGKHLRLTKIPFEWELLDALVVASTPDQAHTAEAIKQAAS